MTPQTELETLAQSVFAMSHATPEQKLAYRRLLDRFDTDPAHVTTLVGDASCIMVHIGDMWIGIEADGYTHS